MAGSSVWIALPAESSLGICGAVLAARELLLIPLPLEAGSCTRTRRAHSCMSPARRDRMEIRTYSLLFSLCKFSSRLSRRPLSSSRMGGRFESEAADIGLVGLGSATVGSVLESDVVLFGQRGDLAAEHRLADELLHGQGTRRIAAVLVELHLVQARDVL